MENSLTISRRSVTSLEHKRWSSVRLAAELIPSLELLIEEAKDEFGMPLFRSKSEVVTEALRQYLRKHLPNLPKRADSADQPMHARPKARRGSRHHEMNFPCS